jgi:predicted CXXCH cytochrome family protein
MAGALRRSLAAAVLVVAAAGCGESENPAPVQPQRGTAEVAQATWDAFYKQQKDRIPEPLVTNPGTPWGDYVGSEACKSCHRSEFEKWRRSFHSRTLYAAADGTVMGDFSPQVIDAVAFDHRTGTEMPAPYVGEVFTEAGQDGRTRYFMRLRDRTEAEGWPKGRERNTYARGSEVIPDVGAGTVQEVILAFGNRRHQPYVARWEAPEEEIVDRKHFVLPFYWNDVEKRWMYDGFRPYVESCAACHTTGIKRSEARWHDRQPRLAHTNPAQPPVFNLRPSDEGWAEGAVGCEVCHGPGRVHVAAVEKVGVERYAELRRTGAKPPTIFSSKRGSESMHRLTRQCDACHDFHSESTLTLIPGPEGYGRDAPHWPLNRRNDRHLRMFYPDGSRKSPCSIGTLYRGSRMWTEGVHCFDCHDPHGSDHFGSLRASIEDNALCTSCHEPLATREAQVAHSKHAATSPGNRCVECHMPRHLVFTNGVQMMSDHIHSHAFSIPKGGAPEGAPPTSCNVCHVDQTESWSASQIRRLWPRDSRVGPATREKSASRPERASHPR